MRIAVVTVPARRRAPPDYAAALVKGMGSMGHRVDLIDGWSEDGRKLPYYDYIAVVAEQTGLFKGRMPEALTVVLSGGTGLAGKKGAAFLRKTGPFTGRAMANLMDAMEKEGMVVNWSDVILNPPQAEVLGKRVGA